MRVSIPLGRVFGVRVGASWSLLVVVAIVALGLARGLLPAAVPGLVPTWYAMAGVATAVGFVATVAAHEVGHAAVARRQGLGVDGIVLWALGGLTSVEGEPASPLAELALSGVGPLVSLVCGGLLVGAASVLRALGAPGLLDASLAWLGAMNILLAVLNVVPAAPLDGGRLLHALVWRTTGDHLRATRITTRSGEVVGIAAAAIGFFLLLRGSAEGIWIGLTGWFIASAAAGERRHALLGAGLGSQTVGDVMTPVSGGVPDWLTVSAVLDDGLVTEAQPVVPLERWSGGPSGLVTLSQLRNVAPPDRGVLRVRDVGWSMDDLVLTQPDETLVSIAQRWSGKAGWSIVARKGHVMGILSANDIAVLGRSRARRGSGRGPTRTAGSPSPAAWQPRSSGSGV